MELPDAVEIHFSLQEKGGESERQVGLTRDGVTEVAVPNSYLENAGTSRDYSIYAFLYISDGKSGNTEYKITMYVQSRPEPKDPETPEDPKDDPFGKTIEAVNEAMKSAQASAEVAADSAKSASESATQAEKSAVESQESAKAAATSEKAAATSATAAAKSERQARESATIASSAADQAAKSATTAAESTTTAAQLAENATRSATDASGSAESASRSAETAKTAADAASKSGSATQQAVRSAAQTATTAAGEAAASATSAARSVEEAGQKAAAAETSASNAAESAVAAGKSATAAGDSAGAAKTSETAAEEAAQTAQEQAERITESAEQIEKNKAGVAALKKDLSSKITKFYALNQGETHLTDSDNGKIQDMMIYGKSSQDGTPTPENPVEIKSVVNPTVKVTNEDGLKVQSVTLSNITLNAIPVSSGGNVTIDGQQYIADYVDVGKKKRVGYILSRQISPDEIREEILGKNSCYILDNMPVRPSTDKEIGHIMCSHLTQESWANVVNKGIQGISIISNAHYIGITITSCKTVAEYKDFFKNNNVTIMYQINPIYSDLLEKNSELSTYYPVTNISINSEQLDGYTVFNYPISMKNGWDYVKKQLNDNRDYIYDMDTQSAEAYVNSEYAVALTELEV